MIIHTRKEIKESERRLKIMRFPNCFVKSRECGISHHQY